MIRLAELAVFLVPLAAFIVWRLALARGIPGPPPRQLAVLFAVLLVLGAWLSVVAVRERLPPGEYVPAQVIDGRIVPGHTK